MPDQVLRLHFVQQRRWYLQRGERGQSWRLARPSGSEDGETQDWLTYPLPLKGEQS